MSWMRYLASILAVSWMPLAPSASPASVGASAALGRNHLASERSPYLRQHASNRVWWWSWSPEALAEAKLQDKPIFLSIGYSTCHWCHVMERESFSRDDVAAALNGSFIAIKVDREERPDLDAYYMRAVELLTGGGGWPMTTLLTPDGQPFFGATYIPHDELLGLLRKVSVAWKVRRTELLRAGAELSRETAEAAQLPPGGRAGDEILLKFADEARARFDASEGGWEGAPKFPPGYALRTLLRIHRRTGDARLLAIVTTTLDAMARGGIYDHVGGGFHRYSTDATWRVPHFEKMLYDQASLANAYLDGYAVTGRREYALVAREILDYVLRDMTSDRGGFFSAQDADSGGREGGFYTWREVELRRVLTPAEFAEVRTAFGISERGDLEGANVLHLVRGDRASRPPALRSALGKLLRARAARPPPARDDKVITAWNGLMIGALARASWILDEPRYREAAVRAARFLLLESRKAGGLRRRWHSGEYGIEATLDDHAFFIDGLLELYQTDFNPEWLAAAREIQDQQDLRFAAPAGGYYFTTGADPTVPERAALFFDDVTPAGNSLAASNLLRLSDFYFDDALRARADRLLTAEPAVLSSHPLEFSALLWAIDYRGEGGKEVAVSGPPTSSAARTLLKAVREGFHPNQVVAAGVEGQRMPPLLEGKRAGAGGAMAYVCENRVCKFPTADPARVRELLAAARPLDVKAAASAARNESSK